jgi:hypothetical protein
MAYWGLGFSKMYFVYSMNNLAGIDVGYLIDSIIVDSNFGDRSWYFVYRVRYR